MQQGVNQNLGPAIKKEREKTVSDFFYSVDTEYHFQTSRNYDNTHTYTCI